MITKKGWASQFMMSLFLKEAAYNAGVSMIAANACSMKGFEVEQLFEDSVANDKEEVTGAEYGTEQEIINQGVKLTYKEPKAKPNSIAGIAALCQGGITSTKDGAFDAWAHKIIDVPVGTALPSIQGEAKIGGVQYAFPGIKGNSFKIAGDTAKDNGLISLEAELIGSGTRTTSATAFVPSISESWLKISNCKVFMESGSDITIAAALTQGTQDISGATPENLGVRLKSFEFGHNNNNEEQYGAGGGGVAQDIDYGRRSKELKFSLLFNDATELDHYMNQDPLAIEFDLKGAIIAAGGAMYYGVHIVIPRFKLKAAPLPTGGAGDVLTCEFDCDIQDDGTNAASIIEVYNAKSAYLA